MVIWSLYYSFCLICVLSDRLHPRGLYLLWDRSGHPLLSTGAHLLPADEGEDLFTLRTALRLLDSYKDSQPHTRTSGDHRPLGQPE